MNRFRHIVLSATLPVLLGGLMAGCTQQEPQKTAQQPPEKLQAPDDARVQRPAALAGQPNRPLIEADEPDDAPAVVASVGEVQVEEARLKSILYRARGLPVLMNLLQLEMAKAEAKREGIDFSPADIDAELQRTQEVMFEKAQPEDYDALMEQFLAQQGLTREEFMLLMEQNAVLRALAEPHVEGRITDEMVREAFRVAHGEKVRIRHIAATNLQEIADLRRRLAEGADFATLARQFSQNRITGPRGGEMLPFSRQTPNLPEAFKEVAFTLDVGQVSDTVQADGLYHILKLEDRLDPVGVRFEDYADSLRLQLTEGLTNEVMNQYRRIFAQQALAGMTIQDPVLREAYEARLAEQRQQAEPEQVRQQMEGEFERMRQADAAAAEARRAAATTAPALGRPATQPATAPMSK